MLKAIHAQESRDAADQKARAIVNDLRCGLRRLRPGNPIERGHAFRSKAATFSDEGDLAPLPA
jgi:hypothetical protein